MTTSSGVTSPGITVMSTSSVSPLRETRIVEPGSTILVARKANEDGEPGEEVDITFIPGEVTPEQVTVPPAEPSSSSDDGDPLAEA